MRRLHTLTAKKSRIIHEERDAETALMMQDVCSKTNDLLLKRWNLSIPSGTQVHIMRSWLRFPFDASPLYRKMLLALAFPLWAFHAKKLWAYSGGWSMPYPQHPAIGVKPPEILQKSDRSMGQRIFVEGMDSWMKVQLITCHELTHASTNHLKLPAWLNEGLAMTAVDAYFGYNTVQPQTLFNLVNTIPKTNPKGYRQLSRADKDTLIYLYVRGYWITRYFDSLHPDVLRVILSKRHRSSTILALLAKRLGVKPADFWLLIDDIVVTHFS